MHSPTSANPAPTSSCPPTVQLEERTTSEKRSLWMHNKSQKGILEYVVVISEESIAVFSGRFTGADQLQSAKSIRLGELSDRQSIRSARIDYLYFDDGSLCGEISTKEAKAFRSKRKS